MCTCLSSYYLYLFGWALFQLHVFNYGSSLMMLTVSFIVNLISLQTSDLCLKKTSFAFYSIIKNG